MRSILYLLLGLSFLCAVMLAIQVQLLNLSVLSLANSVPLVAHHQMNVSSSPSLSAGQAGAIDGWKTYRNEKYGFEVKYPLEVTFSGAQNPSHGARVLATILFSKKNYPAALMIADCSPGNNETLNEYKNKEETTHKDYFFKNVTIGNEHGLEEGNIICQGPFETDPGACDVSFVYTTDGLLKKAIDISLDINISLTEGTSYLGKDPYLVFRDDVDMARNILSTFKFISPTGSTSSPLANSEQTLPTSTVNSPGWQTYRNNEFGFEIKYPEDQVKPGIFIDTGSPITYDPVADMPDWSVSFNHNSVPFRNPIYNPNKDLYDEIVYSPADRQLTIVSTSTTPAACPLEEKTKQGVPYYGVETGFHAGSYITVFFTEKGFITVAGGVYFSDADDAFQTMETLFDHPESVFPVTCRIAKQ